MSTAEVLHDAVRETAQPIYMIAGSKGGVGKSMLSMIFIDLLVEQGKKLPL
jgi:cellulose biosynthesis protein BcsQ